MDYWGFTPKISPKYPGSFGVPPHPGSFGSKIMRAKDPFLYTPSFLIFFHLLGLLPVGGVLEAVMHFFRAHKLLVAPRTQY